MELTDFFPKDGHIQRNYCNKCDKNLDLKFINFNEKVSGIEINVLDLPVLYCLNCKDYYLPDNSNYAIIHLHERATKSLINKVKIQRQKTNKNFDFGVVNFKYDSDDYEYIPGLTREWDKGFLTPVFFNKEVLLKYDVSPTYRLTFASTTYGNICRDNDYSIAFGINKNGKVVMWLGDISSLPEAEQYYLRSENIESDHSIGSEFYDGQIECKFTDLSKEDELYKYRSLFLEECFKKFNTKIAHLDEEVLDLSLSFNSPLVNTEKEARHTSDSLNKIYLESFDKKALGEIILKLGGNPENFGSIKRLGLLLELITNDEDNIKTLMSPFYILYDLRVAYSHLGSKEGSTKRLSFIKKRLNINDESNLLDIYPLLINGLNNSFKTFIELIKKN